MSGLITITEIGTACNRWHSAPCRECASDKSAATALQGWTSSPGLAGQSFNRRQVNEC